MSRRASIFLLPIIYLGFISLGLPDGTLGVAWPQMHGALGLPIGLAGTLILVGTLLSAISSFSSGAIIRRFHTGPVVLVSCALTGAALLIVAHAQNIWWLVVAAMPLGFGAGAVDAGLNGYVARHYSGRHMNWLHACWGIGATSGPWLMTGAIAGGSGWRGGYLLLGTLQLSLAAVFLLTLSLWQAVPERAPAPEEVGTGARPRETRAHSEAGWVSAMIFALYVAVEGTSGLWAGSILVESRGMTPARAGLCTTLFYAAITTGRVLVGFVVDRWGNRRLILGGIGLALAGAALFTQATSVWFAGGALVLLGLGFAPVYPCMMHEVPRRFAPEAVATVIGRQSGAAYIGGAFLPAFAGWLAEAVSLQSIAWAVVAGIVLLALAVRRLDRIT